MRVGLGEAVAGLGYGCEIESADSSRREGVLGAVEESIRRQW